MVKKMLTKKLLRDMWAAKWQFLSIILLSALGVMVFAGLDAGWRDIDVSLNKNFREQKLPDLWVSLSTVDQATVSRLNQIDGVKTTQVRSSYEATAQDLTNEPTILLNGFEGEINLSQPTVLAGKRLAENDVRAGLMEKKFAEAQGLTVGDTVKCSIGNMEIDFLITGLIQSPEYIMSTNDIVPNPKVFGYMYVNQQALNLPANEVLVMLEDGVKSESLKHQIEKVFPGSMVRDRSAHRSTDTVLSEVSQFRSFSYVFPVLFFMVAALVVLTTISRMVDNQRSQMGILKALGYSKKKLYFHYLSYGFFPSLIGGVLGLFIGKTLVAKILWQAEAGTFTMPQHYNAPISMLSIFVCLLSIGLAVGICFFACRQQLKETAAELLRPKPPKSGERILLERFRHLWKKMSFNGKLISRNMFRAKTRSFMALFGILSCTALLISAFGMENSFRHLVDVYYGETYTYDIKAQLEPNPGSIESYQKRVPAKKIEGIMEKPVSLAAEDTSRMVNMTVVDNQQSLIHFSEDNSNLPKEGLVITEKLAETIGLSRGEKVALTLPGDAKPLNTFIADFASFGTGQGIFISRSLWDKSGKGDFVPTSLLIKEPKKDIAAYLERTKTIARWSTVETQIAETLTLMDSMRGVIFLLGVFALLLAFVVIYNMGILNFVERTREFATLKVLGYHNREIRSLIIRENSILSLVGVLLGILPGILLANLALKVAEPDDFVISVAFSPLNILWSCLITFIFSLGIQMILARKVASIDMVSALKSIE
ncbi:ABC transporter permease [Enterococcus sp. ALS3]|uniref:ABC transporter permease n=1 Tax=Enterococcus alishanensis TaxID=1303817 RepID=A0ABS6TCF9_9ENTE|nr:ABC transporter permease [Enterococcus alishanensis]MBV7390534.1 ABC transporter permease [Enterococcus alishanensis]